MIAVDAAVSAIAVVLLWGILDPKSANWHGDNLHAIAGAMAAVSLTWLVMRMWTLQFGGIL